MITWEDLAEQQEMLAKAWTKRASAGKTPHLQRAMLDDAASAAWQAKVYRLAVNIGMPLHQGVAEFLSVTA